jgi:hypothetical protein
MASLPTPPASAAASATRLFLATADLLDADSLTELGDGLVRSALGLQGDAKS